MSRATWRHARRKIAEARAQGWCDKPSPHSWLGFSLTEWLEIFDAADAQVLPPLLVVAIAVVSGFVGFAIGRLP